MELPKNITQIGESDRYCKIYVEDYVISYIKQLNQHARDKELAVALYGVCKEEAGITYLFFYGAGKLNFLQRECRHLSQAQLQEIEKIRRKHFAEYVFLGYRLLNGEMVEGFHVYEQGVCRYITGYAQFYEKNDSMLAFMLEERRGEAKPEEVSQEKYEAVKKRQEERKAQVIPYKAKRTPDAGFHRMKLAVFSVFALLCLAGIATLSSGEKMNDLKVAARQAIEEISEQQLPDAVPVAAGGANAGTIVAEDKLTAALQKENSAALAEGISESTQEVTTETPSEATEQPVQEVSPEVTEQPAQEVSQKPAEQTTSEAAPEATEQPTPEATAVPTSEPVSYTIKRGDTLIGICIQKYGSDAKVSEICKLNEIIDPDDIKIGQKILLP